jgi:hypothetical protein
MLYPSELLPNPSRKLFDCDILEHYLIRYTDTSDSDFLWDATMNRIRVEAICSPRELIQDLSCSILGDFQYEHIYLELTSTGKGKGFANYCPPDFSSPEPVYNEDYVLNDSRGFWLMPIEKINNLEVKYKRNNEPEEFTAIGYVIHTPTQSNFWHYSLRWKIKTEESFSDVEEIEVKEKKKLSRAIANTARVFITEFASLGKVITLPFRTECYSKATPPSSS